MPREPSQRDGASGISYQRVEALLRQVLCAPADPHHPWGWNYAQLLALAFPDIACEVFGRITADPAELPEARLAAARALYPLGEARSELAFPWLVRLGRDPDADIQISSWYGLIWYDDERLRPHVDTSFEHTPVMLLKYVRLPDLVATVEQSIMARFARSWGLGLTGQVVAETRLVNDPDLSTAIRRFVPERNRTWVDGRITILVRKYRLMDLAREIRDGVDEFSVDPDGRDDLLEAPPPSQGSAWPRCIPCEHTDYVRRGNEDVDDALRTLHELGQPLSERERARLYHLRYLGDPEEHLRAAGLWPGH